MSTWIRTAVLSLALATPAAAALTPANVAGLALKWEFPLTNSVTGGPVVVGDVVYAPSWDGKVYALDVHTGAQRWAFQAGGPLGAIGAMLPTEDGKLCFGNSGAQVFCLHIADGSLAWERTLGEPLLDAVWSRLAVASGRLFVSIASLADNPCNKGRLVALDLATGDPLWTFQTVPDRICSTDTAVVCTGDGDCAGGTCLDARGGGVTATVTFDPTGSFVYMNTVGCYTFPSVGDSDSIFKLDATNGDVVWKNRVTPPEQFGFCAADSSVDCSTDAHCAGVGGTCATPKPFYHDFGFLNGPLRIEVPDGGGGSETLIVSGSKNGTLYALHESDGMIAWTNAVQPIPVSPGFAGYGLFNGAIFHADGRIHAALNQLVPRRVCDNDHRVGCSADTACGGGTCLPAPEHLAAFDATDGSLLWSDEIGASWSSVAVVNGVVYAGTNADDETTGASEVYAYDAATGGRLVTLPVPAPSAARAAVAGNTLFVGYGAFGPGGVRAFSLCGNGQLDPDEACDPGDPRAAGCCSAACATLAAGTACDDGDECTAPDQCAGAACSGRVVTIEGLGCALAPLGDRPCGDQPVPERFGRALAKQLRAIENLLERAARLDARGKTTKVEKARRAVLARLDAIARRAVKAAASRRESRRISEACRMAIGTLVGRGRGLVEGFEF